MTIAYFQAPKNTCKLHTKVRTAIDQGTCGVHLTVGDEVIIAGNFFFFLYFLCYILRQKLLLLSIRRIP